MDTVSNDSQKYVSEKPVEKPHHKITKHLKHPEKRRLIVILIIALVIPLTILLALTQQELRKRASSPATPATPPTVSVSPDPTATPSVIPSISPAIEVSPTQVINVITNEPQKNEENKISRECTNQTPAGRPDLFQIEASHNKAKLYFKPVDGDVDRYFIIFGHRPNDSRYGATIYGNSNGVISYTINDLNPNSVYYFKVAAGNGCKSGEYSGIMSITTTSKNSKNGKIFYKDFPSRIVYFIQRYFKF